LPIIYFTPAFEGDEYHAPGFHVESAGPFEVDSERASYLVKTFPRWFSSKGMVERPESAEDTNSNEASEAPIDSPEPVEESAGAG
jgi:hypothetical protein